MESAGKIAQRSTNMQCWEEKVGLCGDGGRILNRLPRKDRGTFFTWSKATLWAKWSRKQQLQRFWGLFFLNPRKARWRNHRKLVLYTYTCKVENCHEAENQRLVFVVNGERLASPWCPALSCFLPTHGGILNILLKSRVPSSAGLFFPAGPESVLLLLRILVGRSLNYRPPIKRLPDQTRLSSYDYLECTSQLFTLSFSFGLGWFLLYASLQD